MANDVILDETADHIISDQESLALALWVEAAMPRVRERLIRNVLEGVKGRFPAPNCVVIECDGKDILKANQAWLTLRKQTWLHNFERSDQSTGIRLGTDGKEGGNVYIGLYLADAVIKNGISSYRLTLSPAVLPFLKAAFSPSRNTPRRNVPKACGFCRSLYFQPVSARYSGR